MQAAEICTDANHQTARIATPANPAGTATFLTRGQTVLHAELTQLVGLNPPTALASDFHAATAALSRQLRRIRGAVRELRRGADPVDSLKRLQADITPLQQAENGHWRALGISPCVSQ